MPEGKHSFVAIANGRYTTLPTLTRAEPDADELAGILHSRHQFESIVLKSPDRGDLLDQIDVLLHKDTLIDGVLIFVWIGHGKVGADHTLRLLGYAKRGDAEVARASDLGEWAVRTGAQQVLVVIDTCFSGAGVIDAVRLAEAVNGGRVSPEKLWFGVIAASLKDEPARSGALVSKLIHVLKEGPRQPDFRWDKSRPWIRGDDLLQALVADWSEPRQRPHLIQAGQAWDLVHNPLHELVPDQPVEHLLFAARGGSGEESYFTGREHALSEIVQWIRAGVPGLFVLTGPPGCGKSAVAGRIVSLSSSAERARLLAATSIPIELDPGVGSIDAQLHARGHTVESASEELARRLGLDPSAGPHGFLAEAYRRRKAGDPIMVVIDGLDEAHAFSGEIALELLAPLAREALVLVATREVPCGDTTLVTQLGPVAQFLDLGQDIEGTQQDIANYVKRRLSGVSAIMAPDLVAEELASGGADGAPQFLLARLVTSQLREHPVSTTSEGWRLALATTVESALERDLQSAVLTIAGKPHPNAGREMIWALALAHGNGFPADDVWPAVATAISPTGKTYTRDDAYAVLAAFGRHLIAGSEGDQPVYRIAHQRLVDYVSGNTTTAAPGTRPPNTVAAVGTAILSEYERLLDAGLGPSAHTYLWRHAWRHLAEAGSSGLAGLHRLVERDREAFLPDLAAGLELATDEKFLAGLTSEALNLIQEAVEVRRQLRDDLKLAMALFKLTFVLIAAGDIPGADEASAEASKLARTASDRLESHAVLGAVLVARAQSQLLNGHYRGAMLLAKEAIELIDAGRDPEEEDTWLLQAAAYSVMGRAAFLNEDLETAVTMCQQAADLFDQQGSPDEGRALRLENLAVLAGIQFMNAFSSSPDVSGSYSPVAKTAAERMLEEYRELGQQRTINDVALSQGLLYYVNACLLDLSRGFDHPDHSRLTSILRESIGLARPFADKSLQASIALGEAVSLSVRLLSGGDPSDCAEAERCLRRFASTSDIATGMLGILLTEQNAIPVAQAFQGVAQDVSPIIARQKEAVALLRRCPVWSARYQLARALSVLSLLLILQPSVEGSDEQIALRSEAIEVWRSLVGKAPDATIQLVGLLCDQSASLLQQRDREAADLAREAVALAEGLSQPQFAGLAGIAETNLGGALLALGSASEAREILQRAVKHLEPLVPNPVFSGGLATAYLNLAMVELSEERYSEALPMAERAVALFDAPDILPAAAMNRPLALIALGRSQRGVGNVELGTENLCEVIVKLKEAAKQDERSLYLLAWAVNIGAPDFWDEVLKGFVDRPDLHLTLNLLRWRASSEIAITVGALVEALDSRPITEHRTLRSIARIQRSRASREFDATWQERTGTIPHWLKLDPAHEWLVIAWWNTGNWRLSRDYIKAHRELLDADTDIVLEEIGFERMDNDLLGIHRQLLSDARQLGADAAYAPLLATIEVSEWVESEDLKEYLVEHEELLRPEIRVLLREEAESGDAQSAVLAAILDLAQRGERQLAFQAMEESDSIREHLQAAWRSKDISRLASLAAIVQGCTENAQLRRTATVALAIARILERAGEVPEEALIASAVEGSSKPDRNELVAIVGDAIEHHPASASELAWLIHAILDSGSNLDMGSLSRQ
jgi:tetratricopeptide (TPR) repeat protein